MNRLVRFLKYPWHDRLNAVHERMVLLKTNLYYRRVFGSLGRGCRIHKPLLLANPRFISIGKGTRIAPGARIEVIQLNENRTPSLKIGSNVNIEQSVHIVCSSSIVIGDNVSITGNCAIVDTVHPFQDIEDCRKIGDRIDPNPTPVEIGEGSFIGYGSVILPNVQIGKGCVIGANSTITRNVPDYCVAAGNPASIVKRYDFTRKCWF